MSGTTELSDFEDFLSDTELEDLEGGMFEDSEEELEFEDYEDGSGEDGDFLSWDAGVESLESMWDGESSPDPFEDVETLGEPDLLGDFEATGDWELFEDEDEFFKKIGRFIKKAARGVGRLVKKGVRIIGKFAGPLLKVLGPVAARIVGTVIGGPAGAKIAGTLASALLREAEYEDEGDAEAAIEEDEALLEDAEVDEAAYDLMAAAATELAESEDEASASRALTRMIGYGFLGFRRNRRLRPHIPKVMRAALALAQTFRGNRKTRWAIQVIPLIVARTMLRLSRTSRITKKTLVEAMARETAWVLASPRRARAAMRVMRRRSARSQVAARRCPTCGQPMAAGRRRR